MLVKNVLILVNTSVWPYKWTPFWFDINGHSFELNMSAQKILHNLMIILSTLGAGNNEANAIEATPLVVLKKNVTNGTTNINIIANNGHQ